MLMKDDDVSTAGGHSEVGCEDCGVPLNDTNQDCLTHDQVQNLGQEKKEPTLPNAAFAQFVQPLFVCFFFFTSAWLESAINRIVRRHGLQICTSLWVRKGFFSFFTAKVVILSLNIKIVCLHQIKQF